MENATLVSKAAFSRLLGVSKPRLSALIHEGLPVDPASGRVNRRAALEWLTRREAGKVVSLDAKRSLADRATELLAADETIQAEAAERAAFQHGVRHAMASVRDSFRLSLPTILSTSTMQFEAKVLVCGIVDHLLSAWPPPEVTLPAPVAPDFTAFRDRATETMSAFEAVLAELAAWEEEAT